MSPVRTRARALALAALLASSPAWSQPTAASAPLSPYVLDGTEVRSLHARQSGRDYQLFVSLPSAYDPAGHRRYPLVVVVDADYGFPLLRSIARRVGDHGRRLDDFVLVGISYARGDTPQYSRRRDFTPSPHGDTDAVSDMPGRAPVFGEAEAYRRFIADDVLPYLSGQYRIDPSHKVFAGHSYGALLGTYLLVTEPTMFDQYILGSPSLWFDDGVMFRREAAWAATHKDLKAAVYFGVGGFETLAPRGRTDRRYNRTVDMVGDLKRFEHALQARHYPGLHVESHVFDGEDHLTVAPSILTHGLLWALGHEGR